VKFDWRDVAIGSGPAIHTSLTEAETEALRSLGADRDVLEIGSAYGYSTVILALAGASVTAVDPHEDMQSYGALLANLDAHGVRERVEVWRSKSQNVLPALVSDGRRFDVVWIDGDHMEAVVAHDVGWALRLLKPTGTLAVHDYDEDTCPGVRVALDRLYGGPGQLTDTLAVYL